MASVWNSPYRKEWIKLSFKAIWYSMIKNIRKLEKTLDRMRTISKIVG